ncbi:serine/threonine-protein kinase GRIK2-like isoform X2 [Rutidosis leptorrhynchoides]
MEMACCGCFGFSFPKNHKKDLRPRVEGGNHVLQGLLLKQDVVENGSDTDTEDEENDNNSYNNNGTDIDTEDHEEFINPAKSSQEILKYRMDNGLICREFPVKETNKFVRSEDEYGSKMVNEYVHECKIGSGSYGKVVLYRSQIDGKHYAIKSFHKSHLIKQRVTPSETAMTDVFREVIIMKMLDHPNIVNLVEVIDDPDSDHFYMVLEYIEGKWVFEGDGPTSSLGENVARRYLRDIVSGLMYLHSHNIVHGDIKPDNLLVTATGTVKIGDFSVSQICENENDKLRRSPGTPVFTAPECCLGKSYHGKTADIWAVGVTLYCMITGRYPFLGDTLQDTYDKIVNDTLFFPDDINPLLKDLIEGLLCKDPMQRMSLETVAMHPWVTEKDGFIPQYICWCKRNKLQREESDTIRTDTISN